MPHFFSKNIPSNLNSIFVFWSFQIVKKKKKKSYFAERDLQYKEITKLSLNVLIQTVFKKEEGKKQTKKTPQKIYPFFYVGIN